MHRLYTYICTIHAQPTVVQTVNKTECIEQIPDEDNVNEEHAILYEFSNGVKVLYKIEIDMFSSDDICHECWISYEVVHDNGYVISPQKKYFYNRCQEKFWLKMQKNYA